MTAIATGQNNPIDITLAAGKVFWANVGTKPELRGGSVMEVPAACGTSTQDDACSP